MLIKLIYKRKILVFIVILFIMLSVALSLLWNLQLSAIINIVSTGQKPSSTVISYMIAILFITGITNYLCSYLTGYTSEYITHDLRMGYAKQYTMLTYAEIENLNAGEQLSKLQNEISGVSDYLNSSIFNTSFFQLIGDVLRFVITFAWLLNINASLTLIAFLPVLLIVLYVFISSKIINAATEKSQQSLGYMNQYADTLLTLFPVIKLFDAGKLVMKGFNESSSVWLKHTLKLEFTKAKLMSISGVLSCTPLLILFLAGGTMIINDTLTIGTLYIFLNLSGNVSGVLMNMPKHIASFRQFTGNMKRLEGKICL